MIKRLLKVVLRHGCCSACTGLGCGCCDACK
ncbi:hypothetical protein SAMN04489729_3171 [Amycolatopsis lurida]|nr:hypothetical protein SAMN04489729_3171 [Amycolatopsis lurida]